MDNKIAVQVENYENSYESLDTSDLVPHVEPVEVVSVRETVPYRRNMIPAYVRSSMMRSVR